MHAISHSELSSSILGFSPSSQGLLNTHRNSDVEKVELHMPRVNYFYGFTNFLGVLRGFKKVFRDIRLFLELRCSIFALRPSSVARNTDFDLYYHY